MSCCVSDLITASSKLHNSRILFDQQLVPSLQNKRVWSCNYLAKLNFLRTHCFVNVTSHWSLYSIFWFEEVCGTSHTFSCSIENNHISTNLDINMVRTRHIYMNAVRRGLNSGNLKGQLYPTRQNDVFFFEVTSLDIVHGSNVKRIW